jgi:hypothetical protein
MRPVKISRIFATDLALFEHRELFKKTYTELFTNIIFFIRVQNLWKKKKHNLELEKVSKKESQFCDSSVYEMVLIC